MDDYGYSTGIARNASESEYPGLWRGLVGLWCPSAGLQGNRLIDFSMYKNHGTFAASAPSWASGRHGSCLSFSAGNLVNFRDGSLLPQGSSTRTLMHWLFLTAAQQEMVSWGGNNSVGQRFASYCDTGVLGVECNGGLGTFPFSPDGKWHHIAITVPAGVTTISGVIIYFDGIAKTLSFSSGGTTLNTQATDPIIGAISGANSFYRFTGKIDDVRIYKRALSSAEIMQSFNGASPLVPLNRPYFNSPTTPPPAGNTTNFFRFFR
jgi:hypothetical protein